MSESALHRSAQGSFIGLHDRQMCDCRCTASHRIGSWCAGLLGALVFGGSEAQAHLVTTGLGPVYDGIGHLFLTPEDILAVVALALLAGMRGAAAGRAILWIVPGAWLLGGIMGDIAPSSSELPFPAISFLLLGVLVAADAKLPHVALVALGAIVAALHGFSNGVALGDGGPGMLGIVGIAASIFTVVALLSAVVVALQRDWMRIVVRVAGSWIAAIGLLLLGWSLRRLR